MMVIWKNEKCQLEKYGCTFFQILKKCCFPNILKKYPLLRARRRQGYFFRIFGKYKCFFKRFGKHTFCFQNIWNKAHPYFSNWHFSFFQITTIYKRTQDTTRTCILDMNLAGASRLHWTSTYRMPVAASPYRHILHGHGSIKHHGGPFTIVGYKIFIAEYSSASSSKKAYI